jgi:hypothetical protein
MVIEDDNMKDTEKILAKFKGNPNKIFAPKDLQEACKVNINGVRSTLTKLMKQKKIIRVSRGKYRYARPSKPVKPAKPPKPLKPLSKDKMKRYLNTLEKTCEIAIHELMLTESLVGKDDRKEIEHQIAFFARYLVKARWEAKHGSKELLDVDEAIFKKAKRIHEWSKYVFEKNRGNK